MYLMLKKSWHGNFRRSVKKPDGITILEWSPGDVIQLQDEYEIEATKDDVGKALVVADPPIAVVEPAQEPVKLSKKNKVS